MAKAADGGVRGSVALVVLGMHRSGTSVLTRLLSYSGAILPRTVIPPKSDNPKGFWESPNINSFNDKLLNFVGSSWFAVNEIDVSCLCNNKVLLIEAAELLNSEFENAQMLLIKDPRICRLFPFWLKVFELLNIDCKVIIPTRAPLQIANSLARRDGFSKELGIWLWLRHYIDAEFYSRHVKRAFVDFEQLLNDWRSVLTLISGSIELNLYENALEYSADIDEFIDDKLPKTATDESSVAFDPLIRSVIGWNKNASKGRIKSFKVLDDARQRILFLDRMVLNAAQEQIEIKSRENKVLEQELNGARISFRKVEEQLLSSRNNFYKKESEIELARKSHEARDEVERELRGSLATLESELESARDSAQDMEEQLLHANQGITDLNEQLEQARTSSQVQKSEIELARKSHEARDEVERELRGSLVALESELESARDSALDMEEHLVGADLSITELKENIVNLERKQRKITSQLNHLSSRWFVRCGVALFGSKDK